MFGPISGSTWDDIKKYKVLLNDSVDLVLYCNTVIPVHSFQLHWSSLQIFVVQDSGVGFHGNHFNVNVVIIHANQLWCAVMIFKSLPLFFPLSWGPKLNSNFYHPWWLIGLLSFEELSNWRKKFNITCQIWHEEGARCQMTSKYLTFLLKLFHMTILLLN